MNTLEASENTQDFSYVRIELPSGCAVCELLSAFPGFQNKCGEVSLLGGPSTICGTIQNDQYELFSAFLGENITVKKVSREEYDAYAWKISS